MNDFEFSTYYHDLLVVYQKNAVRELLAESLTTIGSSSLRIRKQNNFLLQSPTGSGKTIITGVLIDSMIKNIDQISFVWLCETPSLTNQSKIKLKEKIELKTYDYDEIKQEKSLPNHSITFINWEKTKNEKNKARTDSEAHLSIDTLINNTKDEDRIVIFIIDEAHIQTNSEKSKQFLDSCSPDLILEVTATPSKDINDYDFPYEIEIEEVQKAGFIKQGIIINEEKDIIDYNETYRKEHDLNNLREFILHKSLSKRNELEIKVNNFAKEEKLKPYVPLLVIQLPNNDEETLQHVENYLEKQGITRGNGLAVYMNKDYTDELESIGKDETIKALLFKQAIAKGWDCPRASILTFIRDPKSHNFTVQTIGRIMRMPYLPHYTEFPIKYDDLNYGYIYIEERDNNILNQIRKTTNDSGQSIIVNIKYDFEKKQIINLNKSFWKNTLEQYVISQKIENHFKEIDWTNSKKIQLDKNIDKKILSDAQETTSIFKKEEIELSQKSLNDLTKYDIQTMYNKVSKQNPINKDILKIIEKKLKLIFSEERKRQEIIIANINNIVQEAKKIEKNERDSYNSELIRELWSPIEKISISNKNKHFEEFDKKYIYKECWLKTNNLEYKVAELCHETTEVIWWLKNGDHGSKFFSLAYQLNNKEKLFFPDFIVETEQNIYILETKGKLNEEETFEKARTLKDYEQNQKIYNPYVAKKIIAGIVKEENNELYIYGRSNYEKEYNDLSKWTKLKLK